VHLLYRDMLEATGEDVGGRSPKFTLSNLDRLSTFNHSQFKDPLTTDEIKDYEEKDLSLKEFWREAILFPKRFPLSHIV